MPPTVAPTAIPTMAPVDSDDCSEALQVVEASPPTVTLSDVDPYTGVNAYVSVHPDGDTYVSVKVEKVPTTDS